MAYLRLHVKSTEVETIRVSDEVNVDLAPDGMVYGIELLNTNVQLRQDDGDRVIVMNEETGEQTEAKIPLS